jgi:uncharacterized cupredoxin-like copper-binding protein
VRRIWLLALLAALVVAGCNSASDFVTLGEPTASSFRPSSEGSRAARAKPVDPRRGGFEVGFGEWAVTLEAKAIRPGLVTFVVKNGGRLTHGFEIKSEDEGGSNRGPGGGSDDEFEVESATFGPGDTIRIRANLRPGLYEIECFVANHDDLGMRAFLEVREDAPLVRPRAVAQSQVRMEGFSFKPGTIEVVDGTKVVWTNADQAPHTVTAEDQSFGSDQLERGDRFAFRFDAPGEYRYFCTIHPAMKGIVRVTS